MPFEPLRYVHAANLNLDVPLTSIGECDSAIREIVEAATLTSFQRIVDRCIEYAPDFLLLTGDAFDESARSLPARLALRDGFERLDAKGIRVFVLPGEKDPAAAWRAISDLPDNVTVFYDSDNEPVAVIRGDRVIASVSAGSVGRFVQSPNTPTEPAANHWRIGLATQTVHAGLNEGALGLAIDYLALGGAHQRNNVKSRVGMAHHPGSAQGLSDRETGPHGCSLVEVDADRHVRISLFETAPVRWKRIAVALTGDLTHSELFHLMRDELSADQPTAAEQLHIVSWTLRGGGELFDALRDDESRQRLFDSLERATFPDSHIRWLMKEHLVVDRNVDHDGPEAATDSLIAMFDRSIDAQADKSPARVADHADIISVNDPRLKNFAARCDMDHIVRHARQFGSERLEGKRAEGRTA